MRRLLRSPLVWSMTMLLVAGAAFGLYLFQPWKLWVDVQVQEELPQVVEPPWEEDPTTTPPGPVLLAEGEFVSQEHATSGAAQLIEQPDGSIVLSIADLDTSNGPDLRVWLTDQPVDPDDWFVFDDGYHVELGALKGNLGDQVYEVPADVDLDRVGSVSVWCARFSVSFGAAALEPVPPTG